MHTTRLNEYKPLSVAARLAVALVCLERYCNLKGLAHPLVEAYLESMWELPGLTDYEDWESHRQQLISDSNPPSLPDEIMELLSVSAVAGNDFIRLLERTEDIFLGGIYGGADDRATFASLESVLSFYTIAGMELPPAEPFLCSPFTEGDGWGLPVSMGQRQQWRFQAY